MKFLKDAAKKAAEGFKDLAEDVWDAMGDTSGAPEAVKKAGPTIGKYALTSQLLMMLNFPDSAEGLRDSFNVIGNGPTGARGFTGPLKASLENVAKISKDNNEQAQRLQGFADISSTSTYDDLANMLPVLTMMAEAKPTKKRGKK